MLRLLEAVPLSGWGSSKALLSAAAAGHLEVLRCLAPWRVELVGWLAGGAGRGVGLLGSAGGTAAGRG